VTESYGPVNPRVGRIVGGKYRLLRLIGAGGMGEVYEAQHSIIGRRFAIKFLHPLLAGNNESVARFQREAQAAGSLENENIAAVVDAGTADDGAPYLVMEYLDGEDLAHLLVRGGPLPVPRAAYIIIQACRGLAAAHSRGIVHRDLKPENLFICRRNDGSDLVKVLDFGIAKLHTGRAANGTGLTQTGTTMGTPFYMSLEQARGAKEVDQRTDLYALGVILYEILSGAKPHPGESYNEILYHVISKEPAPLDSARPGLPPGLSAVVHKAMAREVDDRYATAADFTAALIPFAGRAVTPLRSQVGLAAVMGETMNSPISLPVIAAPVASVPSRIPALVAKPRSWRAVVWGALAVFAALLGFAILWQVLRHESAPTSVPTPAPASAPIPLPAPVLSPAPPPPPVPAVETPPPPAKVESPPERPPGRPPGQRSQRSPAAPAASAKPPEPAVPSAKPAENPENLPNPQRKPVRPIDRSNPFAE
jgi:serine/threonine-protein kinase